MKLGVLFLILNIFSGCGGLNNSKNNTDQGVQLGNATYDQIVQTFQALSAVNTVVSVRNSGDTPSFTDANMQQMGLDLVPCTVTNNIDGTSTINGNCPISNTESVVTEGQNITFSSIYIVENSAYQALNLIATINETAQMAGELPQLSTTAIAATVGAIDWGYVSFSGSTLQSAVGGDGKYTSDTVISGRSTAATVKFEITSNNHLDTTGNAVVDSEVCTIDGAPSDCSTFGTVPITSSIHKVATKRKH